MTNKIQMQKNLKCPLSSTSTSDSHFGTGTRVESYQTVGIWPDSSRSKIKNQSSWSSSNPTTIMKSTFVSVLIMGLCIIRWAEPPLSQEEIDVLCYSFKAFCCWNSLNYLTSLHSFKSIIYSPWSSNYSTSEDPHIDTGIVRTGFASSAQCK